MHLRAAVPEASAQSMPIHGLGTRAGAPEAAAEFDEVLRRLEPSWLPAASDEVVTVVEDEGDPTDGGSDDAWRPPALSSARPSYEES